MPFQKITSGPNKGKWRSPSGKVWTTAEKNAYQKKHYGKGNKK